MNFENFEFKDFILKHQNPDNITEDQKEILIMIQDCRFLEIYLHNFNKLVNKYMDELENKTNYFTINLTRTHRKIYKFISETEGKTIAKTLFTEFLRINDKYSIVRNERFTIVREFFIGQHEAIPTLPNQINYSPFNIDGKFVEGLKVYINRRIFNQGDASFVQELINYDIQILSYMN